MRHWLVVCSFVFLSCSAWGFCSATQAEDIELFVSPNGRDDARGTAAEPLATIAAAQSRLRELRAQSTQPSAARVWIAEGTYELDEPLEFTNSDNGASNSQTLYAALPGQRVIIRGGQTIPRSAWSTASDWRIPAEARSHVRVAQLSAHTQEVIAHPHPRRAVIAPCIPYRWNCLSGPSVYQKRVGQWPVGTRGIRRPDFVGRATRLAL